MSDEPKICEITYKIKLEWADSESEEIAQIASKIVCCTCEDDDNGDDDATPE